MKKHMIKVQLKLAKTYGLQHNSGQLMLLKVAHLINLLSNKRLNYYFKDSLIQRGIETRANAIRNIGNKLAKCTLGRFDYSRVTSLLHIQHILLFDFTNFDRYIAYNLVKGSIVYYKVTVKDGINVISELLKDLK